MSAALSRRALLGATAAALGVAACSPLPRGDTGPTAGPRGPVRPGSEADDVTGPFSWRRASGTTISVLLPAHPWARALVEDLSAFTELTGIEVTTRVRPLETYVDDVTRTLVSGLDDVDVFMTGAYMVWQYAPPGWTEDLTPWLANPSATSDEYDLDDVVPHLCDALSWDLEVGDRLGTGSQWALPGCWEATGLAYRPDVFAELGLRPPESLDELVETAGVTSRHMAATADGGYGLAVRGSRSWTSLDGGFLTQFTREGGHDFEVVDGRLQPAVTSPESVEFHRRWVRMVRDAGPRQWTQQTAQGCASHLTSGRAAMSYDVIGATRTTSAGSAPVAWSPGPAGPRGELASSLWVWATAISSRSTRKFAAWLFLQWATGAEHSCVAASRPGAEPARRSVLRDSRYRSSAGASPGYLETVEAVLYSSRVVVTPQPTFFDAADAWVDALHQMYSGRDTENGLAALAERLRQRS